MIAITPIGTDTLLMIIPLGLSTVDKILPTGSGNAATSRIPSAIPFILSAVSLRRSIITSDILDLAASISSSFAVRILSVLF